MQTRLLATLTGGFLGAFLASPLNVTLGLTPTFALVCFSIAGLAAGYAASLLFDVFTTSN